MFKDLKSIRVSNIALAICQYPVYSFETDKTSIRTNLSVSADKDRG